MLQRFVKLVRGKRFKPVAEKSARERYAGYTMPNIRQISESEPAIHRDGHHVLIGITARPLKPGFISAHKAKRAMSRS